ncbi:MAG: hypothetical protein LBH19_04470 [Dysgonamonadaceae bacterium]|jgi:hypothetical protein|nr:hypothetical protein [Dysgonamonadaceae bacterium]
MDNLFFLNIDSGFLQSYLKQIIALVAIIILLIFSSQLMKKIQDKPVEIPEEEDLEEIDNEEITEDSTEENKQDAV